MANPSINGFDSDQLNFRDEKELEKVFVLVVRFLHASNFEYITKEANNENNWRTWINKERTL